MPSERVQRRIDRLLDDTEEAVDQHNWELALELTAAILEVDPSNKDALLFERMAEAEDVWRETEDDECCDDLDEGEESLIGGLIRVLLGIVFLMTIYMLPTGIALLRNKRNKASIFVLNLLLGWTFVGWVIALVWGVSHRGD